MKAIALSFFVVVGCAVPSFAQLSQLPHDHRYPQFASGEELARQMYPDQYRTYVVPRGQGGYLPAGGYYGGSSSPFTTVFYPNGQVLYTNMGGGFYTASPVFFPGFGIGGSWPCAPKLP